MLLDPKWGQTETATKRTLVQARKLIERPENWFGARDNPTNVGGHCGLQAIANVFGASEQQRAAAAEALNAAAGGDMFRFNDTHSHAEVLAVFDKAIEAAR